VAVYAIGDLQGCDREFVALLDKLAFGEQDRLWLLGDLINRGPDSLALLRRVLMLQDQCEIILGNHDLHFLATYFGRRQPTLSDTFEDLLAADDVEELAQWLRKHKLLHWDHDLGYVMTHAGIPHVWSLEDAAGYAAEVEGVLAGRNSDVSYTEFFEQMYGDEPNLWDTDLQGMVRYRLITNYLTRLRLLDDAGAMNFDHKGALGDAPRGWRPWYEFWSEEPQRPKILFGHWAALDGWTGRDDIIGLDTGCVWGRTLTAMNLETGKKTSVPAISTL
jgi:bis(5'-nucleosyl)-tetraphosphatase (symmetrical)